MECPPQLKNAAVSARDGIGNSADVPISVMSIIMIHLDIHFAIRLSLAEKHLGVNVHFAKSGEVVYYLREVI